MLENIFLKIINMSLTASYVIIAVLFVRLFLKKTPKIFSYVLWSVVLFRLICPISISSAFSLLGTLNLTSSEQGAIEYIPMNIDCMEIPEVNMGITALTETVNHTLPQGDVYSSVNPMGILIWMGARIWTWGIIILCMYSGISLFQLKRKLKKSVLLKDYIYTSDEIETPFVIGFVRPKIYLPTVLGKEEREYVLAHEQTHIKRKDHLIKMLGFLVLCIHWFNPFVWIAFFISGKDMEMSCDEAVIKKLGNEIKQEYSLSLLAMATGNHSLAGSPLAFGEGDTKSRVKNVLGYKKAKIGLMIMIAAVCALIAFVLLTNPQKEKFAGEISSAYGTFAPVEVLYLYAFSSYSPEFYLQQRQYETYSIAEDAFSEDDVYEQPQYVPIQVDDILEVIPEFQSLDSSAYTKKACWGVVDMRYNAGPRDTGFRIFCMDDEVWIGHGQWAGENADLWMWEYIFRMESVEDIGETKAQLSIIYNS